MAREEVTEIKKRKTRSDKKRDIKPTISLDLKNCIYQLSYITNTPVKDIIETLCVKGIHSRKVIEYLSQYFRRSYEFKSTVYMGDPEKESLQRKYSSNKNERVTTRFTNDSYEAIAQLANALDVTPSKATALLLDASIRNTNLLDAFVKKHLHDHLDNNRMKELRQVLKYINHKNPYDEEISWFTLFSFILEEVKESTSNVKNVIINWLDKHR
ncbi:hypothetical protein [Virgibacillus salexigens]|uniref:hypothetical protein n=1 Tax=Virgibacillus salexigens TaxID=61016 RepID=UPI0030811FFE